MIIPWLPKRSMEKRTFTPGEYISRWENPEPEALRMAKRAPGSVKPSPPTTKADDGLTYVKRP